MNAYCDQCRFFHRLADDPDDSEGQNPIAGECRRHPPRVGEIIGDRINREDRQLAAFPRVLIFDWCGEFEQTQM